MVFGKIDNNCFRYMWCNLKKKSINRNLFYKIFRFDILNYWVIILWYVVGCVFYFDARFFV